MDLAHSIISMDLIGFLSDISPEAILLIFILLAVDTALIVYTASWIYIDSKGRGMDDRWLWLAFTIAWGLLTGPLVVLMGLIYLGSRPKGDLVPCGSCKRRMLGSLRNCPHCGFGKTGKGRWSKDGTGNRIEDVWSRRPLWITTSADQVTKVENAEVSNRSRKGPVPVKGSSLKRAVRASGSCPNCGRDIYDWENRCSRCGRKV